MRNKIIAVALVAALSMTGCWSAAYNKSREISRDANEFDRARRITVVNTRTDTVLMRITGTLATFHNDGDLDIIVQISDDEYAKHFLDLNDWTTYLVEDVVGEHLPDYFYEVQILPEG